MCRVSGWIAIAAVVCPLACSQIPVAGRVTNENELPVAGALVLLEDNPPARTWEATSDPTGAFQLQVPSEGEYTLKVDREGFYVIAGRKITVTANPGNAPVELHVVLESIHEIRAKVDVKGQAGLEDMDRVTPQASLGSRTLYDIPFLNPNSLRSGLRLIPGVLPDNSGGIHLFGGSENQAQYNLEGFQLNDPLTGRFDSRVSLEAVETVDAQPSPADPEVGRGDAGTLLLRARTGKDAFDMDATQFFPSIALGSGLRVKNWTPRSFVSGPWRKGKAWFFNTAEFQLVSTAFPQLPPGQNRSAVWRFNDLLHNQINLSPTDILFVGVLYDFQYAPHSGLNPLNPLDTTLRAESRQWFGYLKDQHYLSHSSMIEFGLAVSGSNSSAIPHGNAPYTFTPDGQQGSYYADARRDARQFQGIVNYFLPAFHFLGEHQLKTGGDLVDANYQQAISRSPIEYLSSAGALLRTISFAGSGELSRGNDAGSYYVSDSWRARPWLLVSAGWRADVDRLLGRVNSSPRAGAAFSPPGTDNLRISASFARIVDATNLQLLTRPLDQSMVSTYYDGNGNVIYGPVTSIFTPAIHARSPHADVWAVEVERALPKLLRAKVELLRRRLTDGFDFTNSLPEAEQLPAVLAGAPNPGPIAAGYTLTNQRQDRYDSAEISLGQPLNGRFQWLVSYRRSRADSNAVIERTVDQPLGVAANSGPLPWDSPNRLLGWGYVPVLRKGWALGFMLDWHTGLPFSIQNPYGQLVGNVDSNRYPQYFDVNLFLERIVAVRKYRVALRGGLNNVTGHFNPSLINNVQGGSTYLAEYNSQPRSLIFQLRLLDRAKQN